jgi:putative heme iron utilization protein
MIRELDQVVLQRDMPEFGLKRGDLGTVVLVHDVGAGYEVEFMTLDGETVAVTTLDRDELREVNAGEIAHARGLADVA